MTSTCLYILSQIWSRDAPNFNFSLPNIIPQDIDEKLILDVVVILILLFLTLLFIEIVLIILWKIGYGWWRRRKIRLFRDKLEYRKVFIAIHSVTGQKHRFFAVDHKHAREILKKTGTAWTIFVEDPR